MSRVFTTHFLFQGKEHVALVSVKTGEQKPHYTIRLFNEELQDILQNDIIEYDGFEGYLQNTILSSGLPRKIMDSIMTSIRDHLEKSNQTPAG